MKHFIIILFFLSISFQNYGQSIDLTGHWTGLQLKAGASISNSIALDFNHSSTMLHYEKERMSAIETEMNWHFKDNQLTLINPITSEKKIGSIVQLKENFLVFKFTSEPTPYFYVIYRTDIYYDKIEFNFPKKIKSVDIKSTIDAENIPDLNLVILDSLNAITNSACTQFSFQLSSLQLGNQLFLRSRNFFLQVITSYENNIQLNDIINEAVYTFSTEIITDSNTHQALLGKWKLDRKPPKTNVRTIKVGRLDEKLHFNEDGTGNYHRNDTLYPIQWIIDANHRVHIIVSPNEATNQLPDNLTAAFNGFRVRNSTAYYQFNIEELNPQNCKFQESNCPALHSFFGKRIE